MTTANTQGAVNALLGEYERAILDLQEVLEDISDQELIVVADNATSDSNCKSIQTILAHVVGSGFSYAIYIQKLKGIDTERPEKQYRKTIGEFKKDLASVFAFTSNVFKEIYDHELEEFDDSKKIFTSWGQFYDIEQMMEHAIVHILRHRRQIIKFKKILRG